MISRHGHSTPPPIPTHTPKPNKQTNKQNNTSLRDWFSYLGWADKFHGGALEGTADPGTLQRLRARSVLRLAAAARAGTPVPPGLAELGMGMGVFGLGGPEATVNEKEEGKGADAAAPLADSPIPLRFSPPPHHPHQLAAAFGHHGGGEGGEGKTRLRLPQSPAAVEVTVVPRAVSARTKAAIATPTSKAVVALRWGLWLALLALAAWAAAVLLLAARLEVAKLTGGGQQPQGQGRGKGGWASLL